MRKMTDETSPAAAVPSPDQLEFDYIKSNFFRVVYVDGVFGGISPRGMMAFAFYNERAPIPRKTAVTMVDGIPQFGPGPTSAERVIDTRTGIVREVETEVVMSIESAEALHRWLGEKIELWRDMSRRISGGATGGDQ
jgi:hypothetical protein